MKNVMRAMWAAAMLVTLTFGAAAVNGQAPGTAPATTPATPPAGDKDKGQVAPLTLDAGQPPVNAEEDAAMKVFRDAPMTDIPKKLRGRRRFSAKVSTEPISRGSV